MKKIKFISFLMLSCLTSFGQNINVGKKIDLGIYTSLNESHNNRSHYEEITINEDHSFIYKARLGEFIKIEKFGNWKIDRDTLILNERTPEYSQVMLITEQFDKSKARDSVYFQVKYFNGEDFRFTVSAFTGDTTLIVKNNISNAILPLRKIDKFSINSTSFEYPKFVVKNSVANTFIVELAPRRLLIDEKWLLEGSRIRPKTTNGQYVGYYLSRKL